MLLIDDYKLEYKLGSGSFADVYYTTKKGSKEIFATKRVEKAKALSDKMKNYFLNEVDILKNTNHQNIIKLYEIKNSQKNFYLIMEYCNGGSLADLFEKYYEKNYKPFPESYVQHILRQISCGLYYLHKSNIIHRDLKMENILFHYENEEDLRTQNVLKAQIKIIDFGFAKYLHDSTVASSICGSPINMDPVILKALAFKQIGVDFGYTEKADIWSLGIMVYTMLIGKPPFIASNYKDLYLQINEGNYNIPKQFKLSKQGISLINGLLQFDTQERLSIDQLVFHEFLTLDLKDFEYCDLDLIDTGKRDITLNNKQDINKIWDDYKIKNKDLNLAQIKGNIGSKSIIDDLNTKNSNYDTNQQFKAFFIDDKNNIIFTDKTPEKELKEEYNKTPPSKIFDEKDVNLIAKNNDKLNEQASIKTNNPQQATGNATAKDNYGQTSTPTKITYAEYLARANINPTNLIPQMATPNTNALTMTKTNYNNNINNYQTPLNSAKIVSSAPSNILPDSKEQRNIFGKPLIREDPAQTVNRESKDVNNFNAEANKFFYPQNHNYPVNDNANKLSSDNKVDFVPENKFPFNNNYNINQPEQLLTLRSQNIRDLSSQQLPRVNNLPSFDENPQKNVNPNKHVAYFQNSSPRGEKTLNQNSTNINTNNSNSNYNKIASPNFHEKNQENKNKTSGTQLVQQTPEKSNQNTNCVSNPKVPVLSNMHLNNNMVSKSNTAANSVSTNTNSATPLENIATNQGNSNFNNENRYYNNYNNVNKYVFNEINKATIQTSSNINKYVTSYQNNVLNNTNKISNNYNNYAATAAALKNEGYKNQDEKSLSRNHTNIYSKMTEDKPNYTNNTSDFNIKSNNNTNITNNIRASLSPLRQNNTSSSQINNTLPENQTERNKIYTNTASASASSNIINDNSKTNNPIGTNLPGNNNPNLQLTTTGYNNPANVASSFKINYNISSANPQTNQTNVSSKPENSTPSKIESKQSSSNVDIKGENNIKILADLKKQIDFSIEKFSKLNENQINFLHRNSEPNPPTKLYTILKDVKSQIENAIMYAYKENK